MNQFKSQLENIEELIKIVNGKKFGFSISFGIPLMDCELKRDIFFIVTEILHGFNDYRDDNLDKVISIRDKCKKKFDLIYQKEDKKKIFDTILQVKADNKRLLWEFRRSYDKKELDPIEKQVARSNKFNMNENICSEMFCAIRELNALFQNQVYGGRIIDYVFAKILDDEELVKDEDCGFEEFFRKYIVKMFLGDEFVRVSLKYIYLLLYIACFMVHKGKSIL